jgi:hypothetical protein
VPHHRPSARVQIGPRHAQLFVLALKDILSRIADYSLI